MANGIGRVWAANAGDDEQRPNGVGSVWIENIDALTPSGGASEEQINELSAAIDYVSANAGDPNALTGYQSSGVDISANPSFFEVKGPSYDLTVRYGGSALFENSSSAVFTNGGKFIDTNNGFISADGNYGFYTSGNTTNPVVLSVDSNGFYTKADNATISADGYYGFLVSGNNYNISSTTNGFVASSVGGEFFVGNGGHLSAFNSSTAKFENGSSAVFSYGSKFINTNNSIISADGYAGFYINVTGSTLSAGNSYGLGYSDSQNTKLNIRNGGDLQVIFNGRLSAMNGATTIFNNGSTVDVTNGSTVGLSSTLLQMNGSELYADNYTLRAGLRGGLNASGSRFVSADSEGVSAWTPDYMTVIGRANQTSSNAAFVIGNGTNTFNRSDLFVIDYSGNAQTNDFIAGNGAKLSDSIQTNELEYDENDAITAINGSAIGGGGATYTSPSGTLLIDGDKIEASEYSLFETSSLSANVLEVYTAHQPFTSTFASALTTAGWLGLQQGDNFYGLQPEFIYKRPDGFNVFVVTSTHFNNTDEPVAYVMDTISAIDDFSVFSSYEKVKVAKQNDYVSLNSAFTAYKTSAQNDYNSLNSAFSSFSASVPNIQMVSTSSEATGTNILYVVTGSN